MLVAIGRRPYTDESFRAEIRASLEQFSRVLPIDVEAWETFEQRIDYKRLDFDDDDGFDLLAKYLDDHDAEHGTRGNRLFYLATQPSQFADLVGQLGRVGLDHEHHDGGWRRIVIEKPFGHDLESAKRLNREVGKVFRESQVYRIDHYLGKETVRNLLVFRFGNGIFEPLWNRRYVDHVQITVAESIGIEARGAFYEQTGAARDVLQNHLLQLVSLVAMEPPATFEANALRDEKVKVLRAITRSPGGSVKDVVRGQYGPGWVAATKVEGYRGGARGRPGVRDGDVRGRPPDDRRLALVGRALLRPDRQAPARSARPRSPSSTARSPTTCSVTRASSPDANLLAIRIQPDEGIMLRFGAKVPGLGLDVRSVTMDFTYGSAFNVDSPDAYETLILDALQGDASLFTRADEVEEAWGIVDPIVNDWADERAARLPELRRRDVGPRGGRRAAGPRRPALAPDLGIERVAAEAPARIGMPRLRWTARAQSIAGIETELARAWSSQDPGPHEPGDMGRHMAARTNVMNLVVVARRPELAERCAATMHWLTGRHPSRTIVIQSADPDGPSWLDARIEAHCVEPRADAPETCAETIYVTCRRRSRAAPVRGRDAADHPRPAGDRVVAGRAAAGQRDDAGPPRRGGSTRRRRVHLERRRPRPAARDGRAPGLHLAGHQRFRAHAPVTLARGDRLDLRRSGVPAVPAIAAPDRRHLQHARRGRGAGLDQRGQADLSRRLAGIATRPVGGASADTRRRRPEGGGRARERARRAASPSWVAASWPPCRTDGPTWGSWSARSCRRRRRERRSGWSCWPNGVAASCGRT